MTHFSEHSPQPRAEARGSKGQSRTATPNENKTLGPGLKPGDYVIESLTIYKK